MSDRASVFTNNACQMNAWSTFGQLSGKLSRNIDYYKIIIYNMNDKISERQVKRVKKL